MGLSTLPASCGPASFSICCLIPGVTLHLETVLIPNLPPGGQGPSGMWASRPRAPSTHLQTGGPTPGAQSSPLPPPPGRRTIPVHPAADLLSQTDGKGQRNPERSSVGLGESKASSLVPVPTCLGWAFSPEGAGEMDRSLGSLGKGKEKSSLVGSSYLLGGGMKEADPSRPG